MGIVVRNLNFSYSSQRVLENISFEIGDGEFVGLVGPTGSGKTTLAYCLQGLIPNSIKGEFSGEVIVDGLSTKKNRVNQLAKKIGLVFQDPDWQLFSLTVEEELAFGVENLKLDRKKERIKRALELVNLKGFELKEPSKLSQGEKQRLCLASVLAMDPETIVLDEPSSSLDYKNAINVYEILRELNERKKIIIVIEHDTDFLWEYSQRVLLMNDGKILMDGPARDVLTKRELLEKIGVKVPKI